jgi:hypothetical protein
VAGIKGYRPSLHNVARHRRRTKPEPPKLHPNYNGTGEAEVVPGFQMAEEIRKFQRFWEVEYPDGTLGFGASHAFLGPLQFIEEETERVATKVNTKYLSRILSGELQVVALSKAEAILMALSKEHMLLTGEIQVVPNPNWSLEKWISYMAERGCI